MRPRRPIRRRRGASISAMLVVALAASVVVGMTAANSVATSRAGDSSQAVTADTLKPVDCAGITLVSVVVGNVGTNQAELLIGSTANDAMDGNQGNDCILGGGGADSLRGSQGTDVCVGGPGVDTFHPSCETQIQ